MTTTKAAHTPGPWLPIEQAPKPADWMRVPAGSLFVVGRLSEPFDSEGEPRTVEVVWAQVCNLSFDGWYAATHGMSCHGHAQFRISGASHFFALPVPTEVRANG